MGVIEPSGPQDIEALRRIGEEVFAEFGDYGQLLPRFFTSQGVTTYVARIQSEVAGFVMVGFLPWSAGDRERELWIADLLAIAVRPGRQRRGLGSAMMQKVFDLVEQMGEWRHVKEIQLTCAASNRQGLDFFKRHGFEVIDPLHGTYSSGQPAWRLARKVSLA